MLEYRVNGLLFRYDSKRGVTDVFLSGNELPSYTIYHMHITDNGSVDVNELVNYCNTFSG